MNKPAAVRRREILALLKEQQHCTIGDLSKRFAVSVPTIHRDIDRLVAANQAHKIHGGVEYMPAILSDSSWDRDFEDRINQNRQLKLEIAKKAIRMVQPDDVIFIDCSTTSLYFAREIARAEFDSLTVVTNSRSIASEFHRFPGNTALICIGGVYNPRLNAFLGGIARDSVDSLRIRRLFFSAVGISENGVFTYHEDHAGFLRRLIERCETASLLLDSTKLGREAAFRICTPDSLHTIIVDGQPAQRVLPPWLETLSADVL